MFIDAVNYVTVDTSCFATLEAKNESKMKVAARQVKEMWSDTPDDVLMTAIDESSAGTSDVAVLLRRCFGRSHIT